MNVCTWLTSGVLLGASLFFDPPKEMGILGAIAIGVVYLFSLIGALALNGYLFEARRQGRTHAFRIATIIPLVLGLAWNGYLVSIFLEALRSKI